MLHIFCTKKTPCIHWLLLLKSLCHS
jgi:hypothetical protein